MIRTTSTVVTLTLFGCTLVVGTEPRVVGDGGASTDAAPTAMKDAAPPPADKDAASPVDAGPCSATTCVDTESQCQADCASALSDCQKQCMGGPKGTKCNMDCQMTSQSCGDQCVSRCQSCADALGCPSMGCTSH